MFQLFILPGLHWAFHEFISGAFIIENVRCMEPQDDVKTNNPYPTSAKEYFLNILNERARPPEDISYSTYLTSVIDDIFGTQYQLLTLLKFHLVKS